MAGIFDGLEAFGLNAESGESMFKDPAKKEAAPAEENKPQHTEEEYILDKTFKCPVCGRDFKSKVMKAGKAKLVSQDMDLRPRYEFVDATKYDIIMCPKCGYAALTRYFETLAPSQEKRIRESVASKFGGMKPETESTYSYDAAKARFKLALVCTMVKQTKASELAYLMLRNGWLIRGEYESLDQNIPNYAARVTELQDEEEQYLSKALEGFLKARETESFPIAGMNESTLDYIISVLATRFEKYDVAAQLVSKLLTDRTLNARMRDNLQELKETIIKARK